MWQNSCAKQIWKVEWWWPWIPITFIKCDILKVGNWNKSARHIEVPLHLMGDITFSFDDVPNFSSPGKKWTGTGTWNLALRRKVRGVMLRIGQCLGKRNTGNVNLEYKCTAKHWRSGFRSLKLEMVLTSANPPWRNTCTFFAPSLLNATSFISFSLYLNMHCILRTTLIMIFSITYSSCLAEYQL